MSSFSRHKSIFKTKRLFKKRGLCLALLVAVIALLAYSQFFGLQMADFDIVAKVVSHSGTDAGEIIRIFTQADHHYDMCSFHYRPVQSLAWWVILMLGGMNFSVFHMVNFLLHALNSVLVFLLARRLLRDKTGLYSFAAAALFALHPTHLNTVVFTSRVPELLITFSALSSLLLLFSCLGQNSAGAKANKRKIYMISIATCALGVFSKEAGALVPVVLLLCLLIFSRESSAKRAWSRAARLSLPYFLLVALYFGMMLLALGKMAGYTNLPHREGSYIAASFIGKLLYPVDFLGSGLPGAMLQKLNSEPWLDAAFLAVLFAAVAAAMLLSAWKKAREPMFLIAWIMAFLVPFMAYGYMPAWYVYPACAPLAILLMLALKGSVSTILNTIRPGKRSWKGDMKRVKGPAKGRGMKAAVLQAIINIVCRAVKACAAVAVITAITLLAISLLAYSPLVRSYPHPWTAGRAISGFYSGLGSLASALPEGLPENSTIFAANMPKYLILSKDGLDFSVNMVNEGSLQAMADFVFPGSGVKAVPVSSYILTSDTADASLSLRWKSSCWFSVGNKDNSSSSVHSDYTANASVRSNYDGGVDAIFSRWNLDRAFLVAFDGARSQYWNLSEMCG